MTKKRACRCLGPEKPHDEGELPGCMYPADPADRRIWGEINLGFQTITRLNAWHMYTLRDLTKHGGVAEFPVPEEDRSPEDWRGVYIPLLDIYGLGVAKLLKIRLALREHGLALADEDDINRWQPIDAVNEGP